MSERTGLVTFKGNPITLVGEPAKVGAAAPNFTAQKSLVEATTLSAFAGKTVVLSVAPSVDTGVCATQLRKFNEAASELGDDVVVAYITMDLPFALSRFCGAEGIKNVVTLTDYKARDFGAKFGVYMKELGLLARSAFVVDAKGTLVYEQIAPEMTGELDLDAVLAAVKAAR
jgi:thiol peroxidase